MGRLFGGSVDGERDSSQLMNIDKKKMHFCRQMTKISKTNLTIDLVKFDSIKFMSEN